MIRETIEEVRASGGGRLVRHTGDRVSPTFMNALPPRYGFERTEVLAFELNDPRPRLPRLDVPTALVCAALVRDEAGIRKAHAVESRILLPNAPALWNRRYIPTCAASRALYAISLARKVTLPRAAGPEPDHRHGPPHGVAVGRAFNQCKPLPKAHTMPWSSYDFGRAQDVVPGSRALRISRTFGTGVRYFGLSTGICWRCAASDGVLIIWWSDPMIRGLGLKLGFRWGSSRALPAGRGGGARCVIPWEERSVGRFGDPSPGRPLLLAWYALLRATPLLFRLGVRQDASGQGSCRFRGRPRGGACRKTRSAAVPASRRVARRC